MYYFKLSDFTTIHFLQHRQAAAGKKEYIIKKKISEHYLFPHLYNTSCICQYVDIFMFVILVDLSTWFKQGLHEEVQKCRHSNLWRERTFYQSLRFMRGDWEWNFCIWYTLNKINTFSFKSTLNSFLKRHRLLKEKREKKGISYELYFYSIKISPFFTKTHVRTMQWEMWNVWFRPVCNKQPKWAGIFFSWIFFVCLNN